LHLLQSNTGLVEANERKKHRIVGRMVQGPSVTETIVEALGLKNLSSYTSDLKSEWRLHKLKPNHEYGRKGGRTKISLQFRLSAATSQVIQQFEMWEDVA
jgi:hypothetical protein